MRSHTQEFIEKGDFDAVEYKRLEYKKALVRLRISKLHEYQAHWVREVRWASQAFSRQQHANVDKT